MSVLIKDMEMPTMCGNCPVHKLWPEDDEAQCMIKRELWTKYSKRNPDCPLIEVPPHGDLVDINALKLAILDVDYVNKHDYLKGVLNAINHATTVIESDKDGET